MELRAVITYWGNLAHYIVTPDNFGVYHARLLKFEGANGSTPPENLILVKGAQHWVSSCDEEDFAEDLGCAIEQRVRADHPHSL
jgi:hypothetical protein